MDKQELKYQITALIDNEITDPVKVEEIKKLIETDPELKKEYTVILFTKNLVQKKCEFRAAPNTLRNKIKRRMVFIENPLPQPIQFLRNIFSEPVIAVSSGLAAVLIAVILILNQGSSVNEMDFAIEQTGSNNMFVQAVSNFDNLVCGKMTPQILSDNPDNIQKFFAEHGVKYSTLIPQMAEWQIIGAVVSEGAGEKFAHHVYSNKKGQMVYLFQVDESYVNRCEAIKLSKRLVDYLEKGNCYCTPQKEAVTLMKKIDKNIFAVVANTSQTEIENLFCSR